MIRLLKWLFWGDAHLHKWKIIKQEELINKQKTNQWTRYTLQCEHCGNIKFKNSNQT